MNNQGKAFVESASLIKKHCEITSPYRKADAFSFAVAIVRGMAFA